MQGGEIRPSLIQEKAPATLLSFPPLNPVHQPFRHLLSLAFEQLGFLASRSWPRTVRWSQIPWARTAQHARCALLCRRQKEAKIGFSHNAHRSWVIGTADRHGREREVGTGTSSACPSVSSNHCSQQEPSVTHSRAQREA